MPSPVLIRDQGGCANAAGRLLAAVVVAVLVVAVMAGAIAGTAYAAITTAGGTR